MVANGKSYTRKAEGITRNNGKPVSQGLVTSWIPVFTGMTAGEECCDA